MFKRPFIMRSGNPAEHGVMIEIYETKPSTMCSDFGALKYIGRFQVFVLWHAF